MKLKKLLAALAVAASLCLPYTAFATCSNYTTYSSGQTLTASSLNSLQSNYTNCTNNVLDGDTFTGNMLFHSGTDAIFYSDTGSTLKAAIYGDSGKIIGFPMKAGTYNLEAVLATTTNSGDSVKIQCGGAACSATNPGFVVIGGTTAGILTGFPVTADVTLLLTGATWGAGGNGDITGAIIRLLYVNDNGTLRTCAALIGGRHTVLTTDTNATQASVNLPEEILCNTAVASATNKSMEFGYVRANFDDTGGAAEDLWAIQTGIGDVVTGLSADGQWQPWNPTFPTGWSANPTVTGAEWTQYGREIHAIIKTAAGTSNSASSLFTAPTKAERVFDPLLAGSCQVTDNGSAATTPGMFLVGTADSTTIDVRRDFASTNFTASGTKNFNCTGIYIAGPAASFIE